MLNVVKYASQAEWLANRRLGASDAATIMGVSPFKSKFTLWCELTGIIEPSPMSPTFAHWGHTLEPIICAEYERLTHRLTVDHGRFAVVVNPSCPWLSCTLDREILACDSRGNGVLEAKNAGAYKAKEWTDQAPRDYQIQVQAQLTVTGYSWGSLAALIGGNDFRWADVARNDDFIATYLKVSEEFWRMVQDKIEPPRDGSESTSDTIRRLYSDGDGSSVVLPSRAADWHMDFEKAKADMKSAEDRKNQAYNSIASAIGQASSGVLPQGLGSYRFTRSGKSRALRFMKG